MVPTPEYGDGWIRGSDTLRNTLILHADFTRTKLRLICMENGAIPCESEALPPPSSPLSQGQRRHKNSGGARGLCSEARCLF